MIEKYGLHPDTVRTFKSNYTKSFSNRFRKLFRRFAAFIKDIISKFLEIK